MVLNQNGFLSLIIMGSILGVQGTVDFTQVNWNKKAKGVMTTLTEWSLEEVRGLYNKYRRISGT